jgi:DNA-binding transcriptional regulator YiaG
MNRLKDINGYEGLYYFDKEYKVCSYKTRRELKYFISNSGYKRVNLYKDGKYKKMSIHRLIALNFIPNPENKKTVNHKDSDRLNNSLDNLEWATHSENNKHTHNNNRHKRSKDGERRRINAVIEKESKLTYSQAEDIRRLRKKTNLSYAKLAKMYNVSAFLIGRIIRKESYKNEF